jgi:hypothetical protein
MYKMYYRISEAPLFITNYVNRLQIYGSQGEEVIDCSLLG